MPSEYSVLQAHHTPILGPPQSFLMTQVVCSVCLGGRKVALSKLLANGPFKQSDSVLFSHPLLFPPETLFCKWKTDLGVK